MRTFVVCLLSFLALAGCPPRGFTAETTNRYELREEHSRDGIGKFYKGREIAHIIGGDRAIEWLERPQREEEEKTTLLISALELRPGQAIADIGAGSGYLTRRLAEKVRPSGKVLAVEIQAEMLTALTNRLTQAGITNVVPILGTLQDPQLPPASVDMAIMVDVYHEFSHPHEMMEGICRGIKPGGQLIFVEYRAEDPKVPIKELHKMSVAQVQKEMADHPLKWVKTIPVLPWQHIIVFERLASR